MGCRVWGLGFRFFLELSCGPSGRRWMPPNRQQKWPEGLGFCVLDGPRPQKMGLQDRNTILLMVKVLLFGTLDPQGVFMCTPEDEGRFLSRRLTKRDDSKYEYPQT